MPHGRGHNKGFEYYMCKKFFHPNNPQNLERVWMKKQELTTNIFLHMNVLKRNLDLYKLVINSLRFIRFIRSH